MAGVLRCILVLSLCQLYFITGEDDSVWRCPQDLPDTTAVFTYRDQCYQFVDNEVHWPAASAYCMRHGGHLVSIHDAATNQFLVSTLNALPWRNNGVWIGLHDRNGELNWEWATSSPLAGERLRWTNWGRGHPKGIFHGLRDCVRMKRGKKADWLWHETFCSVLRWKYRFICQYEAIPTTTPPPPTVIYYRQRNNRLSAPRSDTQGNRSWGGMYAAQKSEKEEKSGRKLATTVAVTCLIGSLAGIVLLVLLLLIRRRRRQTWEEATLRMDNPTYGPDDMDIKKRGSNEYTVNVYTNPMELRRQLTFEAPRSNLEFSALRKKNFSGDERWDYMNVANEHYLPMDGNLKQTPETAEDILEGSNIYEDIPINSTEEEKCGDDDSVIYEELKDPKVQEETKSSP